MSGITGPCLSSINTASCSMSTNPCARSRRINGLAPILILLLLRTAARDHLALCNGIDRTSPELQINGCTAIIDLGERTPAATIAYDNRGDAYPEKGAMTASMVPSNEKRLQRLLKFDCASGRQIMPLAPTCEKNVPVHRHL